jgi:hypothetical protein
MSSFFVCQIDGLRRNILFQVGHNICDGAVQDGGPYRYSVHLSFELGNERSSNTLEQVLLFLLKLLLINLAIGIPALENIQGRVR